MLPPLGIDTSQCGSQFRNVHGVTQHSVVTNCNSCQGLDAGLAPDK